MSEPSCVLYERVLYERARLSPQVPGGTRVTHSPFRPSALRERETILVAPGVRGHVKRERDYTGGARRARARQERERRWGSTLRIQAVNPKQQRETQHTSLNLCGQGKAGLYTLYPFPPFESILVAKSSLTEPAGTDSAQPAGTDSAQPPASVARPGSPRRRVCLCTQSTACILRLSSWQRSQA